MHKEVNELCIIYPFIYGSRTTSPCSRSMLITFTVRLTKQHPVNISFLKKQVQRTKLVPIFYSAIKHGYQCFMS